MRRQGTKDRRKGLIPSYASHGEVLHNFDSLSANLESTEPLTVKYIIKGLALNFLPENFLSKQNCAMRRGMRKPRGLKVKLYNARFIHLNKYLDLFREATLSEKAA